MSTGLTTYHKKRDFGITGEPRGRQRETKAKTLSFVIQKHGARRLHYDLRLEWDGVMKSWAVTRGPSFDPQDKRLAVRVEDHPVDYNKFEGVIPAHQYGAGPVMIWDAGTWEPEGDPRAADKKGHISFTLNGAHMRGRWHLVRMQGRPSGKHDNWLLIKGNDEYVLKGRTNKNFLEDKNTSLVSGRTLEALKSGKQKNSGPDSTGKLLKKYGAPELATLVLTPPAGEDWWHEIKYDGYRIMAFIGNGDVILRTRGLQDWTHKFTPVAEELKKLDISSAVIDGELGVLDQRGVTSFSALQQALMSGSARSIEVWFFDLLHLNGEDYTEKPLSERKAALEKLLGQRKLPHVHYSDHFKSSPELREKACQMGLEGLVSKNKNSPYHFRRTHDWVKCKCGHAQEFIIGGYMPAKKNPKAVGALLLGYYEDGKLLYAGKVGIGFDQQTAKDIYKQLCPLIVDKSSFSDKIGRSRRQHLWVKPEVLCEVSFWEWTADRHIRHSSFKGLREDKKPEIVRREIPEKVFTARKKNIFTVEGVTITHPDREVYPGTGITKGDVATYYAKVLPYIFPFMENRLVSLLRCTETIAGECFFQRGVMKGMGKHIFGTVLMHHGNKHDYLYIKSPEGLMELVQMNALEFHVWQSRVEDINKPDQFIFDLDPGEKVPFEAVKLAAEDIRRRLKSMGIISFPRLSGGKGIHVAAAINPRHTWEAVKSFTRDLALQMEKETPEAYVSTMTKTKRTGKIFIDYLRNDYSATAITPFSLRARPGAPAAVPVTWQELKGIDSAAAYTLRNIDGRINKRTPNLIKQFFDSRQDLKI
jgi:bifunctional non-homologous end joining protein LigD